MPIEKTIYLVDSYKDMDTKESYMSISGVGEISFEDEGGFITFSFENGDSFIVPKHSIRLIEYKKKK